MKNPATDKQIASSGKKASVRARLAVILVCALVAGLMVWNPPALYVWIKAIHVVAIISWMAGLLYLPRLFVYHSDSAVGSDQSETFKVMESRLYHFIMTPAMLISWVLGLWLAYEGFGFSGYWLWLKIVAVFALTATHGYFGKSVRLMGQDQRPATALHWRKVNEIPTVLMIFIVIMVIVKPF
ncbi:MAG: protoporphyrinogen oxidase HemJ [Rhizobiaceae bacterium]|nr:protoporphyrinogen oxidase HemJ [Rhizobiaceae bacterium]|tara:strand:- start:186966 stop:187514 length:549 start_codon:yes stop_codon:yes gene_type:complete